MSHKTNAGVANIDKSVQVDVSVKRFFYSSKMLRLVTQVLYKFTGKADDFTILRVGNFKVVS